MTIGMTVGLMSQCYTVIAEANGFAMGKSDTAPSPYVVWRVGAERMGVCSNHYFNDREEAEWDFCARAFEWFEDNVNIHMIEDDTDPGEAPDDQELPDQPIGHDLIVGLKAIRAHMTAAAQLVDEMCAEIDRLKGGA